MNPVFNCMNKKQSRAFKLPLRDKEDFKSQILFSNEWGGSFYFSTQRKSKCFQM